MKLKIHIIILMHFLAALLAMMFYSNQSAVSVSAISLHCLVVSGIYITLIYCMPRRIIVLSITITSTLLTLLYISNMVAIQYWNDVISWSFIKNNSSVIINELKKFPTYFFILTFIALFLIFKTYSKWLDFPADYRKNFGLLPIFPLLLGGFYSAIYFMQDDMAATLQGEPLFEFFNKKQALSSNNIEDVIVPKINQNQLTQLAAINYPNIILIHADGLRADRLSSYGNHRKTTPFIDDLIASKNATKIINGMSNCSETVCGISSVTASGFSFKHTNNSLFKILNNAAYITNFIGTGDLYHAGLDQYLTPITHNFFRADLNDNFYKHDDKFLIDILSTYPKSSARPHFFYLRMMSSHELGSHSDKYKRYTPITNSLFSMAFLGGNAKQAKINSHDNYAIQLDAYVRSIFSILKEKRYLDNAILVIFGDHGDAMGEHGTNGHYNSLYQEEIHVPIIFWTSDNIDLALKTNSFATLMDIPTTLMYHIGIPIPQHFLGSALQIKLEEKFAFLDSKKDTVGVLYQQKNHLYKLIIPKHNENTPLLFELNTDPGEHVNLHQQHPTLTAKLLSEYKKFSRTQSQKNIHLNE